MPKSRMTDLEVFLRSGPGRCRSCGAHIQKQGHAPDCPTRKKKP